MENNKPAKVGNLSIVGDTAEVTFGENKFTIHRLKAGKFYDALKIYMDIIKEITPNTLIAGQGGVPSKEVTVDFNKLIVSMFQTWPEKMIKFITICCSTIKDQQITEQKIKEESYPEQITEAFRTCMNLNRVAENLKNFVAPISELGVQVQPKQ